WPNGRRSTSGYSRRYPRRTSCKDHAIRTRDAALPVRCPASGRGETEAAAQCRQHGPALCKSRKAQCHLGGQIRNGNTGSRKILDVLGNQTKVLFADSKPLTVGSIL